MSSEYIGPDPEVQKKRSFPLKTPFIPYERENTFPGSVDNGTSDDNNEDTHIMHAISPSQAPDTYQEPAYREHVSGNLAWHPADAPNFRPVYQPYGAPIQPQGSGYPYPPLPQQAPYVPYPNNQNLGNQNYAGYPSANAQAPYYPYPAYGYPYAPPGYPSPYGYPYPYPQAWAPTPPKRDGYLLGMSITAFAGSILVLLAGVASIFVLLLMSVIPATSSLGAEQQFAAAVEFVAFAVAGIVGGGFTFYHSFRSLFLKKPSRELKLPWFWIFFVLYLIVVVIAAATRTNGRAITNEPLTIFMIALAGILPSLTVVALGVRRVHFPRNASWPTTWRRFAVALVSGATLAIVLALVFELVLTVILQQQLGVSVSLDNPNQAIPQDPKAIIFLFLLVSVVAPLVEEAVKPLAVVIMIGRIRSAGEAFILGLACGTGFNLIETAGYMGAGYNNWLDVALQRTSSGLLHGFGAAMISLGWYYLTHPKESRHRILLPLGCWTYAILQHAIWNGSFGLQLLPAPIGPYLSDGVVPLGSLSFPAVMLVYGGLTILMLTFFFYMTKKVRPRNSTTQAQPDVAGNESARDPNVSVRV